MEFIWSCMVIFIKGTLGGLFWSIAGVICFGIVALFIALIAGLFVNANAKKKHKYKGQKIVIQGGKKNE